MPKKNSKQLEAAEKELQSAAGCLKFAVSVFVIVAVYNIIGVVFQGGEFIYENHYSEDDPDGTNNLTQIRWFFAGLVIAVVYFAWRYWQYRKINNIKE